MDWEFIRSITLIVVGSLLTFGIEAARRLLDRGRIRQEREDARAEVRRVEVLKHTEELYSKLNDMLAACGRRLSDGREKPVDHAQMESLGVEIYRLIPLVADDEVRELVKQGMWGVSNPTFLSNFDMDDDIAIFKTDDQKQRDLLHILRTVVATYLRGGKQDADDRELLDNLDSYLIGEIGLAR